MNTGLNLRFAVAERCALRGGIIALLISGVLAWVSPQAVIPAYRFATFACFGPPLGCLLFTLIYKTTGGQWGEPARPFLTAGVRLLPWSWLPVLPLLYGAGNLDQGAPQWPDYFSVPMVATRSCFYAVVFFAVSALAGRPGPPRLPPWLGPAGLIVMVFMLHLLAQDWIAAPEPHWYSTAFPIVWISGQAVAGIAAATLALIIFGRPPPWEKGVAGRELGLDWGNLMLAATMFWVYVTFAQLLIIWAGNMPSEISWYVRRSRGGWLAIPIVLGIVGFLLPLLVLLSKQAKRSGFALGALSGVLLLAQWLYLAWAILPAFHFGAVTAALSVALLIALGGFWTNRYLAGARRQLEAA